jgi:hypothetical protein
VGDGVSLSVSKGVHLFREKAKQLSNTASATNTLVEGETLSDVHVVSLVYDIIIRK